MRSVACMFVLGLAIVLSARAPADPAQTPADLHRLERIQGRENACVLVRDGGRYHYERSAGDRMLMFEGIAAKPELQQLVDWGGKDEIVALSQDKIVTPVFTGPKDGRWWSVNRPGRWQNLPFPAPPTWQRYPRSGETGTQ